MESLLSLLLWPFSACLILTGIHTYLGIHVIRRGVIFVDLALAQMAALGATAALLFGADLHDPAAYWASLGMTLIGAAFFSLSRLRDEKIPQEAMIGIVYVVSAAAAVIVLDRAPGGAEHIRGLLVGNILTVTPAQITKTALLYAAVGLFHWFFRKTFLLISFNPDAALRKGYRLRLWDFLFYAAFGVVVTSSVSLAGVLLVFAFLIVPAVASLLAAEGIAPRLWIGWGIGTAASLLGLAASVMLDLPTGAAVVCAFGLLLLVLVTGRSLLKISRPGVRQRLLVETPLERTKKP
ncbi:MAG: metal ABC transporter permease [Candidatus Manganitrophaceae bacterium]|nr:MAG: metal ABC transporter permease [Candidatus Manganitrophaceae bacterium]